MITPKLNHMGVHLSKEVQAKSKPTGSWECLADGGKWATYDAPNNTYIEAAFGNNSPTVTIRRGKWEYTIDFVAMTQTNTMTCVSRTIRRDGLQATASSGGGGAVANPLGFFCLPAGSPPPAAVRRSRFLLLLL